MNRCRECNTPKVPSDRPDACGRPIERCPRCQGVVHHSSRPADLMHPSLAGHSQVVPVVPARPVPPTTVVALEPHVPDGFLLRRAPGVRCTYVLIAVATGRRTVFSARPEDVEAVLDRELALLNGQGTVVLEDEDEPAPGAPKGPHPSELPSDHPRAVAWRLRIQRGRFRQDTWSDADVQQLREWYATHSRSYRALPELAQLLGRTPEQLSRKARHLGLTPHSPRRHQEQQQERSA